MKFQDFVVSWIDHLRGIEQDRYINIKKDERQSVHVKRT